MDNVITNIKKSVEVSIDLSFNTLRKLKKDFYKNKLTNDFILTVNHAKIELIYVCGEYTMERFKSNNIEKSPRPLVRWIVEVVNDRFDNFIEKEVVVLPEPAYI